MKKSKKFYKIQMRLGGTATILGLLLFIKGGIEWWTGSPNGFENATTLCWGGTAIMSGLMTYDYIRNYKKFYGGNKND